MAVTTSWTADDLAILERAIASGAKKVKYSNDQEVEYRELSDMLKTREEIKRALANDSNPSALNDSRVAYTTYTR